MYAKVFAQMLDSSIADDWRVRHVFMDMLVLADRHGIVDMTREAISRRTGIPVDIIEMAVEVLEAPDPSGRRPDHEGRRIVRLDSHRDWGWLIVNYDYYRKLRDEEERTLQNREAKRRQRMSANVSNGQQMSAQIDVDADIEIDTIPPEGLATPVVVPEKAPEAPKARPLPPVSPMPKPVLTAKVASRLSEQYGCSPKEAWARMAEVLRKWDGLDAPNAYLHVCLSRREHSPAEWAWEEARIALSGRDEAPPAGPVEPWADSHEAKVWAQVNALKEGKP